MQFVELKARPPPSIDSAGLVQYVAWETASHRDIEPKAFWLYPNGALVKNRRLVAIADTPEDAWALVSKDTALMDEFGVDLNLPKYAENLPGSSWINEPFWLGEPQWIRGS
jgi:hypothetical protein